MFNNYKVLHEILITDTTSLIDAIKQLEVTGGLGFRLLLIVDNDLRLLGTLTDGDIRRALLNGHSMDEPITGAYNSSPLISTSQSVEESIKREMKKRNVSTIPCIDDNGILIGLKSKIKPSNSIKHNQVFLMAGGLGSRLYPLTKDCPKPLLKINSRPILERIIEKFIAEGFYNFTICVNYKSELFVEYFEDGSSLGVNIDYLFEKKRLGTAGALSNIKKNIDSPIIVMNADLLNKAPFSDLLEFHEESKSKITMAVREYDFKIPYGVVETNQHQVISLDEKPVQSFFVNCGIYCLAPEVVNNIPKDTYYDMTTLIEGLLKSKNSVTAFPIHEYWLDIGHLQDFEKAQDEYRTIFEKNEKS